MKKHFAALSLLSLLMMTGCGDKTDFVSAQESVDSTITSETAPSVTSLIESPSLESTESASEDSESAALEKTANSVYSGFRTSLQKLVIAETKTLKGISFEDRVSGRTTTVKLYTDMVEQSVAEPKIAVF